MLDVNAFGNTIINCPGSCTVRHNGTPLLTNNSGGTMAVSEGNHIVLFLQYRGTIFESASRKLLLCSSGIPYQIFLAPVCRYSIHGRPCGSRYQQQALNNMPTCNVGTVTPIKVSESYTVCTKISVKYYP